MSSESSSTSNWIGGAMSGRGRRVQSERRPDRTHREAWRPALTVVDVERLQPPAGGQRRADQRRAVGDPEEVDRRVGVAQRDRLLDRIEQCRRRLRGLGRAWIGAVGPRDGAGDQRRATRRWRRCTSSSGRSAPSVRARARASSPGRSIISTSAMTPSAAEVASVGWTGAEIAIAPVNPAITATSGARCSCGRPASSTAAAVTIGEHEGDGDHDPRVERARPLTGEQALDARERTGHQLGRPGAGEDAGEQRAGDDRRHEHADALDRPAPVAQQPGGGDDRRRASSGQTRSSKARPATIANTSHIAPTSTMRSTRGRHARAPRRRRRSRDVCVSCAMAASASRTPGRRARRGRRRARAPPPCRRGRPTAGRCG